MDETFSYRWTNWKKFSCEHRLSELKIESAATNFFSSSFFYKKLEYPHDLKGALEFAHFLVQKNSFQFLIFGKNKKFWAEMVKIILK